MYTFVPIVAQGRWATALADRHLLPHMMNCILLVLCIVPCLVLMLYKVYSSKLLANPNRSAILTYV